MINYSVATVKIISTGRSDENKQCNAGSLIMFLHYSTKIWLASFLLLEWKLQSLNPDINSFYPSFCLLYLLYQFLLYFTVITK